jgi:hypothetical protein
VRSRSGSDRADCFDNGLIRGASEKPKGTAKYVNKYGSGIGCNIMISLPHILPSPNSYRNLVFRILYPSIWRTATLEQRLFLPSVAQYCMRRMLPTTAALKTMVMLDRPDQLSSSPQIVARLWRDRHEIGKMTECFAFGILFADKMVSLVTLLTQSPNKCRYWSRKQVYPVVSS